MTDSDRTARRPNTAPAPRPAPRTVIHVPHSATAIPADLRDTYALTPAELEHELLVMTDWFTDELFAADPIAAATVRHPVSRLVIDPERFPDDADEAMAAIGMGAAYTRTSDRRDLRALTPEAREALMQRFYWPHHRELTRRVAEALEAHATCLVIDAHSFPSGPLPYEMSQDPARPEICLGTDECHTPGWLADAALEATRAQGWAVERNRPFAGSIVPADYYRSDLRVHSIMIEVRRDLYMDEATGEKTGGFDTTKRRLSEMLATLAKQAS